MSRVIGAHDSKSHADRNMQLPSSTLSDTVVSRDGKTTARSPGTTMLAFRLACPSSGDAFLCRPDITPSDLYRSLGETRLCVIRSGCLCHRHATCETQRIDVSTSGVGICRSGRCRSANWLPCRRASCVLSSRDVGRLCVPGRSHRRRITDYSARDGSVKDHCGNSQGNPKIVPKLGYKRPI